MSANAEYVVIGGTGLIGSQVLGALRSGGHAAVGVARTQGASDTDVVADITGEADALRRAIDNARVVVHAAPYVGRDAVTSEHANVHGTRRLVDVCVESDVERILYVSTAAVYGMGPHRGLTVDQATPAPASPASSHRLRAEGMVRDAGGSVVRPSLVYGIGDRWLFPGIASFLEAVDALPDTVDDTRSSLIRAEELGRLIAGLAVHYRGETRTWNATPPHTVSTRDVCSLALHASGSDAPRTVIPGHALRARALDAGLSEHQYDLIFNEHTYDPGDVWAQAGITPTSTERLPREVLGWYRGQRVPTPDSPPGRERMN